jgi:hypothetical protein
MRLARESFEQAMRAADDPAAAERIREILDRALEEMRGGRKNDQPGKEGTANA